MRREVIVRDGYKTYLIEPRDSLASASKPADILSQLDRSGAMIGLLPELTLTPALVATWSTVLRGHTPPPESRLRAVLIGTGHHAVDGDAPMNRAYLLDRFSGETLCSQDKLFGFTTSGKELADWGYDDMAQYGTDKLDEELTRGSWLGYFETDIARIVVLICEDLARVGDMAPQLTSFAPSLILAPVLDRQLNRFEWGASSRMASCGPNWRCFCHIQQFGGRTAA